MDHWGHILVSELALILPFRFFCSKKNARGPFCPI